MKSTCLASITAILLLAAASCTSVKSIQEFSKAAKTVAESAKKGFGDFDDMRANALREAKVLKGERLTNEIVEKLFLPGSPNALRLEAMDKLAAYASGLEALATHNPDESLKTSGASIRTALEGINSGLAGKGSAFGKEEIGLIAGLFVAAAKVKIEKEREQHLREILTQANPGVKRACGLLEQEFTAMSGTLAGNLTTAADDMMTALNANKDKWSLSEQREIGTLIQQTRDNVSRGPAACKGVAAAAKKLAVAHEKLASSQTLTSEEAWAAVGDFADRAKAVKDIFDSISKPAK